MEPLTLEQMAGDIFQAEFRAMSSRGVRRLPTKVYLRRQLKEKWEFENPTKTITPMMWLQIIWWAYQIWKRLKASQGVT